MKGRRGGNAQSHGDNCLQALEEDSVGWEAVAVEVGYSNGTTAKVRFGQIRRKLGCKGEETNGEQGTKLEEKAGSEVGSGTNKTPSKVTKGPVQRAPKKTKTATQEQAEADALQQSIKEGRQRTGHKHQRLPEEDNIPVFPRSPESTKYSGGLIEGGGPAEYYREYRGVQQSSNGYTDITTNGMAAINYGSRPATSLLRSNGNGSTPEHPSVHSRNVYMSIL
ncbi:hypothetical protein B0J14DRAFT_632842 [Halenospora varia]|nr:hypothetical protein B0J14DRAFT_632842 [Halenospora varia]